MRIALIADTFPPSRSSGAVQLRDLSREFARQGHAVCVLLPASEQNESWRLEEQDGVQVMRIRAPKTKEVNYLRRSISELVMPFVMLWYYSKSPLAKERWDGVVWYSPSIFHGPLVSALKTTSGCRTYLIIRDIFPEWAVDVGLIGRGLSFRFFAAVARYQYSVADVIGVQTPGNKRYFSHWLDGPRRHLEVLPNWLGTPSPMRCSIRVDQTCLAGRRVFVYAGNMGVAQGLDIFIALAEVLSRQRDVGFLFVGRGSETIRLKNECRSRKLDNVAFFDEIEPDEIPDLYMQCTAGIVALDPRHKSHNIPGKFLTYMQSGLPVLANINAGNDLFEIIRNEQVGYVCETNNLDELHRMAQQLLEQVDKDPDLSSRCRRLFDQEFTVENTVKQILSAINK